MYLLILLFALPLRWRKSIMVLGKFLALPLPPPPSPPPYTLLEQK